jgi:hypothetical protein
MDQSLWWANQKHWAAVISYLLHYFPHMHIIAAAPYTSHRKLCNYCEPKPFSWAKPALSFIQFWCAGSHTKHCWRCSNLANVTIANGNGQQNPKKHLRNGLMGSNWVSIRKLDHLQSMEPICWQRVNWKWLKFCTHP